MSRRSARSEPGMPPAVLFLAGLLLAPAFLLQRRLELKALQTLLLFGLAAAADPLSLPRSAASAVVFLAVTVAFNLLTPLGRVLARVGPLAVTQQALALGLDKALTLLGLLYLSRFFVRRQLRLPGAAGRYLARTLGFLDRLVRLRPRLSRKRLAHVLDASFASLYGRRDAGRPRARARSNPAGLVLLGLLLALNYGLLLAR